jgi:hypothetical protein
MAASWCSATLGEYYPTALDAFEDWSTPASWRFLQRFPTPQALQQAGKRRWENFLQVSHLWRDDRDRFGGEPQALQCLAGTAPVTRRTCKPHSDPPRWPCHQRWACDKHLRHAVHLLAEKSLTQCAWAEIYYRRHREKGRSHADTLRRLGQRWLKIIHRMWMDRKPYDAMLHKPKSTQTRLLGTATQSDLTTPTKQYSLKTNRTSSLVLPLYRANHFFSGIKKVRHVRGPPRSERFQASFNGDNARTKW